MDESSQRQQGVDGIVIHVSESTQSAMIEEVQGNIAFKVGGLAPIGAPV